VALDHGTAVSQEWAPRRKLLAAYGLTQLVSILDALQTLADSGNAAAIARLPDVMTDVVQAGATWRRASGNSASRDLATLTTEARAHVTDNVRELDSILEGRSFVDMEDLRFVDPPLLTSYDWDWVSAKLRANPGRWAQLGDHPVPYSVISAVRQGKITRMRPSDGFKVRSRNIHNDEEGVRVADLYLRFDEPEDE